MKCRVGMKKAVLLIAASLALANASQYNIKSDSLKNELWLEAEKAESIKICLDTPVREWKTSLSTVELNDSCLAFQAPTLIGVETLNVYFPNSDSSHKINLAVGMRYLDFKNEKVLLGYNEYPEDIAATSDYFTNTDPERFVSVTGTYLVDKYPITNCEITQLLWDDIPDTTPKLNPTLKEFANNWISRKKRSIRNENCSTKDSAANTLFLYQIMKYANARSIREGLKPYYHFTTASQSSLSENQYFSISYLDFTDHEDGDIYVLIDTYSDGYRIPYYNEWMMFARGGDKKNEAPWGNYSSATLENAQKYAKLVTGKGWNSEPVGQLLPNGYGLYDIFGLVWEHVFVENASIFPDQNGNPSRMKGGNNRSLKEHPAGKASAEPYWKHLNYGSSHPNWGGYFGGGRLIRNIGNNVKWSEVKSESK